MSRDRVGDHPLIYVCVKPSDAADFKDKLDTYYDLAPIWVPAGTYDLGDYVFTPTLTSSMNIIIHGAGRNKTIINCSGASFIDPANTAWTTGIIEMQDLKIVHTAPAGGIGLDFSYASVRLTNVLVVNDSTETDKIGIKLSPPANAPVQTLYNVEVVNYGYGFHIASDHIIMHNCQASETTQAAYYYTGYSICVLNLNPHIYLEDNAGGRACHGHYFHQAGENITIVNPYFEPHAALGTQTGNFFYHSDSGSYVVNVFSPMVWLDSPDFANIVLSNLYTKVMFHGTKKRLTAAEDFRTENSGYETGNGAQQTIAHGCRFTPSASQVYLSERRTGGALAYQSAAPDATNIYVTATNLKDYNWRVSQS